MHWTGTWTTASAFIDGATVENRSLRMLMRTSIDGDTLRLRLSNAHGSDPVIRATTTIALRKGETANLRASQRALSTVLATSVVRESQSLHEASKMGHWLDRS